MIYDWQTEELGPGRVIDASGESHQHVFHVDTETGDMIRGILDDSGMLQMNAARTEILKEFLIVPAPVMVIWS